jgi:flagellar secretion chaperone FliS
MAYSNQAYSNKGYSNFDRYLEAEVSSADPVKLVCMLYRGAIEATAAARRHLKAREIAPRSRQIMRTSAILRELSHSLDPQYQEISGPLSNLYAYMQKCLLEANAKQIDPPLAEVEQLLSTLLEGWKAAAPAAPAVSTESTEQAYQSVSCTY